MSDSAFVDTNVLVYLYDDRDQSKQSTARSLLDDQGQHLVLSTQVLGELYVTITRKLAPPVEPEAAARIIGQFSQLPVVDVDALLVRAAIATSQQSQLSYWDALIIEAAVAGGCDRLLTDDLAAGSVIRGVRIENPFAGDSP